MEDIENIKKQNKNAKLFLKNIGEKFYSGDVHVLNKNSIIFEIGAYIGEDVQKYIHYYNSIIYCFEPIKSFYDTLVKNFSTNSNIKLFNFGLGNKTEEINLYLSDDGTSQFKKSSRIETGQIIEYTKFINEHKIEWIDRMNINIEGGEYELLLHLLNTGEINKINIIYVQFHYPNDETIFKRNNIRKLLENTHDEIFCYDFVWEKWIKKI